jgi:hypothetical protein
MVDDTAVLQKNVHTCRNDGNKLNYIHEEIKSGLNSVNCCYHLYPVYSVLVPAAHLVWSQTRSLRRIGRLSSEFVVFASSI